MVRIVVIGNINIDIIAFLDELPSIDEGREAKDWRVLPGGSGANFSVAARSLGADVELYAAVGTGTFSKKVVEELERAGVKVFGPLKEGEQSMVFIASTPKGKVMYSLKGVSHSLRPEELPERFGADVVHVATKPPSFVEKYLSTERLSYSPGTYAFEETESVKRLVGRVDFLFLNKSEAMRLGLYPEPEVLPREALVITLGGKGSLVYTRGGRAYYVESLKVEVVDTTGAGDVYAAAFLVTYLTEGDIIKAAKAASAAGALAVTVPGGQIMLDVQSLKLAASKVGVREMRKSPTPEG
ncbi:carbohydrate kinase family protein [Ignicoccus hospitalis]|uniref:PfkB domain protein n=1 Tax=Ignicoccus hospitalis (strain KIN4/I / DSM 18386 / JCM 14125) TaxID=453591 RepID=A8A8H3_IGNH4|nr:PfkB family carbohydrate kinase [Ignicoccus hospitalis]ABU81225.1 PfkB domain protein [Ignicoccus hospitalis KIN4/I]HIH90655.1 hypothetical protein [Desulfurococcaceae archaeon]